MSATALVLGVHLLSFHADPHQETITPGVYAIAPSGVTLGFYRNSERGRSTYLGWSLQGQHWAVTVGAVTGYRRAPVLPIFVPSYRFDNGIRLSVVPNPWGASALHLSKEFR